MSNASDSIQRVELNIPLNIQRNPVIRQLGDAINTSKQRQFPAGSYLSTRSSQEVSPFNCDAGQVQTGLPRIASNSARLVPSAVFSNLRISANIEGKLPTAKLANEWTNYPPDTFSDNRRCG